MRTLLIAAVAALALTSAQAAGQPKPDEHHADAAEAAQAQPTHEMCKAVMGRKMDGKTAHDHGKDKTGQASPPETRRLSKAEMEKMHARCAEKMRAKEDAAK